MSSEFDLEDSMEDGVRNDVNQNKSIVEECLKIKIEVEDETEEQGSQDYSSLFTSEISVTKLPPPLIRLPVASKRTPGRKRKTAADTTSALPVTSSSSTSPLVSAPESQAASPAPKRRVRNRPPKKALVSSPSTKPGGEIPLDQYPDPLGPKGLRIGGDEDSEQLEGNTELNQIQVYNVRINETDGLEDRPDQELDATEEVNSEPEETFDVVEFLCICGCWCEPGCELMDHASICHFFQPKIILSQLQ